jgi:hypothetical protein
MIDSPFLKRSLFVSVFLVAAVTRPNFSFAHGFAGARFFPATLATDDPFVADELSLPTFKAIRQPGSPPTTTYDFSGAISKRITKDFGISFGDGYQIQKPRNGKTFGGFDNIDLGAKYQVWTSELHETLISLGVDAEIGGTGRKLIGADSFSTITPAIFFGKGLGDIPVDWLRPIAITGSLAVSFPTQARTDGADHHPNNLEWGVALEYSLIYLRSQVKDMGLKAPFDRMIPVVEFAMQTPLNRGNAGPTTGTINPGLIWSGKQCQFGVEAVIPINDHTGHNVGVLAQLHFYLDDLLPSVIGRPLIGN